MATAPEVSRAVQQDRSLPLALIPPKPHLYHEAYETYPPLSVPRPPASAAARAAAAAFLPAEATVNAAPAVSTSFQGVGNGFSGPQGTFTVTAAPPDTNGDVGPNHYLQIVNTDFAIFSKDGTVLYGPAPVNTIWSGFGGGCEDNNDGDPITIYDSIADRWIISQFSERTTPYLECVAVSQTSDPTGAYYRYAFSYGNTDFPDYPKIAVWPDGYYATYNIFRNGSTFAGARVCALDRASMLQGRAATQQCFDTSTVYGGVLPSDVDGSQLPPAGSPNYLLALGATDSDLAFWKFHVDWTNSANSTFTGPISIPVAPYVAPCNGMRQCIPQPNTTVLLDVLSDRLMFRLSYRNFGDHESLVANHSIAAGNSVGVRWYEIRNPATTPTLYQQGTYAPDSNYRWMGSIAMDQSGNIGLGFSLSGSSVRPSVHYTGRLATDPVGTMPQGEGTIFDGVGSQTGSLWRWGDYSMMAVDPTDDCTFWYTNEYLPTSGSYNWQTYVGSFKFPGCGPTYNNDFSLSANPSTVSVTSGFSGTTAISTTVVSGSPQPISFTISGLPAGVTATFNPTSVNAGDTSTLTLNTGAAYNGTYSLTVTGTAGTVVHNTVVTLTITGGVDSPVITNGGFETGTLFGWTSAGSTAVTTGGHSGTYAARLGNTTATNGDSSISQTFTVPASGGTLTFFYKMSCPDSVTYDWVNAKLKDNVSSTVTTILPNTCATSSSWVQVSYNLAALAGHSVTLTLLSHDDDYPTDPTYTYFDDVGVSTSNDFSISANPTTLSISSGGAGTSTISTAVTSGAAQTVSLSVSGLPTGATASFNPASVTAGGSSTLTVNSGSALNGTYTLTITGTAGTTAHTTTVSVTITGGSQGGSIIINGDFETGSLTGWTSSGTASVVSGGHSGNYAARVGSTAATNGDSTISQTFTVPAGGATLSFYYKMSCPDSLTYDWANAKLKDNATSTVTTILLNTCTTNASWVQISVDISASAGHSVTLTLLSHDDDYPTDPTYTMFDDVVVTPKVVGDDFSISANPSSITMPLGGSGTSAISTAVTSGAAQIVSLSVSGVPAGASASFSPTSVSAGTSSTLTVQAGTAAGGSYSLTVTGTGPSATHTTPVALTIGNAGPVITNGGFETGTLAGWTPTGTTSVASGGHTGLYAAELGSNVATTDSTLAQTFTVPATGGTLSFWYKMRCPDSVYYDWAKVTLRDNTTSTTVTLLPNTCVTNSSWVQVTASLAAYAGHSVTLTLTSHDDDFPSDPTYTLFDDVTVQ